MLKVKNKNTKGVKDVIDVARVSLLLTLDMFLQLPLNSKCLMDTGFKQSYID